MVSADRIQITLTGGAPWGFRLSGGGGLPLIINKIRKKSQAHVQGLKEGDAVISINSVHVHDKTLDEALELVEAAGDSLTLEIFRGDKDGLSGDKPKKPIQVPSPGVRAQGGTLRLVTTSDDGVSPGEVILIPSGDSVTSYSLATAEDNRFRQKTALGAKPVTMIPVIRADSSSGRTVTATVSDIISSSKTTVLDKSPVISSDFRGRDIHSSSTVPTVAAKPFFVSQANSPGPNIVPQNPPQYSQQFPPVSSAPQTSVISQSPYAYSPQPPPSLSPQPPRSPQPPPVSPKPQLIVSSQAPPLRFEQPGVTSSRTLSTFDDGQTHREVTREQRVQRSDDGRSATVVQRETTTTTTGRPSFVKSQTSAFNANPPSDIVQKTQRSHKTTSTTLKSTTSIINQKGPTPFISSPSSNILQPQFQPSTFTTSRSTDNQFFNTEAPLFKPTRFVPASGKKDVQGLYTPSSPLVDFNVQSGFKDGKENMSPQPMFQVKNIVSDKAKSSGGEIWRPNLWLPDQQPPNAQEQAQVTTPREDFSSAPSYPASKKPGYSLVEEQKRKLLAFQTPPKSEYNDPYSQEHHEGHGHHKHERLHIFAPPVEIHADQDTPYSPYDDHYHLDEYDDGPSSPDSYGTRRKNLYSDSAFYDTPGQSYPTITDQMKLCKTIAKSLTSAANRRAKGAKMFMKRKRKSSKWIHEGHSELSSSAGDVANLHELDSELAPEEGGNKPLLYFKIPSIKNRVGNEAKQTKMALTQEQFEKLRLSSKRCDHTSLPPDPCFDIVADLKAHKGKGGRMFERRKQRSDKFVIDESNAKFSLPQAKFDSNLPQSSEHHLTPREVALKHGWKGDAATSQNILAPPLPVVRSSLKSDEAPCLIKGTNFNRTAKGWAGGGEYPVAENLRHISPIPQPGPSQSSPSISQPEQQNYNRMKTRQPTGESASVSTGFNDWQRNQPYSSKQGYQQPRRQDVVRGTGWEEQRQPAYQAPRPKSWQPENDETQNVRGGNNYTVAPVDYRPAQGAYPTVAYKQPIIPGTDL